MKNLKKVLSVMLVLVMVLGIFVGCKKKEEAPEPKVDTSWYKDTETTFTLTKANQLMGLAELAKTKNFEGKTIKLGADIELNEFSEAILAKWQLGTVKPENKWTPLGNKDLPFAGIFDGQGHKISGLCVKSTEEGAGFIGVSANAQLLNVKFVNGYIKNTTNRTGLIGLSYGAKIENVYTNLLIETYGNGVGGFIGWFTGGYPESEHESVGEAAGWVKNPIVINNCWFDGTLTTGGYAVAGCIGGQNNRSKVVISNFLSTGTINANIEANYSRAGGIFGWMNWEAPYILENCLSVATINAAYKGLDAYVGSVIGDYGAQPEGPSITNCYSVGKTVIGKDQRNLGLNNAGILKTVDELKSATIETLFPKLAGETESPWQAVEGSTPILKGMK